MRVKLTFRQAMTVEAPSQPSCVVKTLETEHE